MKSEIKIFPYPDGEIQRVHLVQLEDWQQLDFWQLSYAEPAMDCFAGIYRQFLVPKQPWAFGNMIMFRVPDDLEVDCAFVTRKYGVLADKLTAAAVALHSGVRIIGGRPIFKNRWVKNFWHTLEQRNCLEVVSGKLPVTTVIPVGNSVGFMTQTETDAALKMNASFFVMDRFDCATVFDHIGTPLGLRVKNGVVENPPLFRREALLVKDDGSTCVGVPDLCDMKIEINGSCYMHGSNAILYSRPKHARTPCRPGVKLVIVGCRVVAVHTGCSVPIPASGFVLCPEGECTAKPGDRVIYRGMEDIRFGIQVGNSIVKDGVKTEKFLSPFYNIRGLDPVPFPPSLYPLDYMGARAARTALGADAQGKPMLLWAEGAAKIGHIPGKDSCGATLGDMARICSALGMVNGVNMDGGGSAQLLLHNKRSLMISDRNYPDGNERERPVPLAIIAR